ncbi:unnamed protein product [Menidia menidia]|uniref:(Atlantic silverside) hypothetical protein n=1 Tax=Menidia menidia TaxID=238744 RepID=A0A8S4B0I9_9TELE|nr:unnamed protein product [Menidia menidia]
MQIEDISPSVELRENGNENVAAESTEIQEEQTRNRFTSKTDPMREPVKNKTTVEEIRGGNLLTLQLPEKQIINLKAENEKTLTKRTEETLEINKNNVKRTEERPTSATTFTSQKDPKMSEKYSKSDKEESVATDTLEVTRNNDDTLLHNSNTEPHGENSEVKTTNIQNIWINGERKHDGTDVKLKRLNQTGGMKEERVEWERERKLVMGIHPDMTKRRTYEEENPFKEKLETAEEEKGDEKIAGKNMNNKEDQRALSNVTSPPSASTAQSEIPATMQTTETGRTTHTAELTRQINRVHKATEREFVSWLKGAKPKPEAAKFISADLHRQEPNPAQKSKENTNTAEMVSFALKPKTKEPTVRQNKAPPLPPHVTTSSASTPSSIPTKPGNSRNTRTKVDKRIRDEKMQKPPNRKNIIPTTPVHFPYFMDDYCPPECACYGRVVQCSDKGVNKIPYGIPYNARYILLMNNQIDSIQLDLLSEYVSMEFLVLSNNQLKDGTIEGAFEGVPALKRLYLDRNLLESVPIDLPSSLEELRLDNNNLKLMSEAVWTRCPGLLVLSLSNNSLGSRSESLPREVFSPLCELRTLNLDHNHLGSVPQGLPLSLKELYLRGNLIDRVHAGVFNGLSGLMVLDLSSNRLTDKGLVRESLLNATHIESLNLEGNRLKQFPRHLPPSLKTLSIEGNCISSIRKAALSRLKNLEHLGLARNKIFKVAPGAFRMQPVLHQLDLCHNSLQQVPRQLPPGLHLLALTHNKIQSVPRDAFCWGNKSLSGLVRVQLEHNLIDMGNLDTQAFRCLRGFQVVHF